VVLHTNLGRAPLAAAAVRAMTAVARGYSNLEYDLGKARALAAGAVPQPVDRADRRRKRTGREQRAALAAGAGRAGAGADVAVSRGELVEVGGGFRIPEIMARSAPA